MGFGGGAPEARYPTASHSNAISTAAETSGTKEKPVDGMKENEKDVTGTIAGLDLDGYKGSRQHFRAELKSRLEGGPNQDVGSLEQPAIGIQDNLHAANGVGAMPHGSPTVAPASKSPTSSMKRTGSGLGSRKPSFAALESHFGMESGLDSGFELAAQPVSSATNLELLDPEVVGKSSKLLEFSDCGTGDFREPSFRLRYDSDGSTVAPIEYSSHRIFKGKPSMPGYMPGLYIESPSEATTLIVEMIDRVTNLKMNLYFTVFHNYDVITRRSVVVNDGDKPVCIHDLVSSTVDFDAESAFYDSALWRLGS